MRTKQLHITNGDSVANIIKASSVDGDVLPWRDPMHHGPFPTNLTLDALGNIRAEYLASTGHDVDDVRRSFQLRNKQLRTASEYDEVILWFEHDLLDQLQILELLNWLSDLNRESTVLTLICINQYAGIANFRGLGQLSCEQIESLLPTRQLVTPSQIQLAKSAWACFGSDDPVSLENVIHTDTSALPFLSAAFRRYFQEYPWIEDGLTRTERQVLTLVSSGVNKPADIFMQNMELEDVLYIGDWTTYQRIARMCNTNTPLLSCTPNETFHYPPDENLTADNFQRQILSLTTLGHEVISGALSASTRITRDEWLGGVHFQSGKPMWMWDASTSRITLV